MAETATALQIAPAPAAPKLVKPETLFDRIQRIHDDIACRAFELFEREGGFFGHELDHWFKAESELLHPCNVGISEAGDVLTVEAEVPGFAAADLQVAAEPQRVTITAKKESNTERKEKKNLYEERHSNELLRIVDLPAAIDPAKATAELSNGVLVVKAPKAQQMQPAKVEVKSA